MTLAVAAAHGMSPEAGYNQPWALTLHAFAALVERERFAGVRARVAQWQGALLNAYAFNEPAKLEEQRTAMLDECGLRPPKEARAAAADEERLAALQSARDFLMEGR